MRALRGCKLRLPIYFTTISSLNVVLLMMYVFDIDWFLCILKSQHRKENALGRFKSFQLSEELYFESLRTKEEAIKFFTFENLEIPLTTKPASKTISRPKTEQMRDFHNHTPTTMEISKNKPSFTEASISKDLVSRNIDLKSKQSNIDDNNKITRKQLQLKTSTVVQKIVTTNDDSFSRSGRRHSTTTKSSSESQLKITTPSSVHALIKETNIDLTSNIPSKPNLPVLRKSTRESPKRVDKVSLSGKVNVYIWSAIFHKYSTRVLHYNDMFPNYPRYSLFNDGMWEDKVTKKWHQSGKRFTGYIIPKQSGTYQFQLASRDGSEMILIRNDTIQAGKPITDFILRFHVNKTDTDAQNKYVPFPYGLYTKTSKPVYLSSGVAYLIDVCLIVGDFGAIQVSWKKPNSDRFTKIDANVLFPLFNTTSKIVTLPNILYENFDNDALRHLNSIGMRTFFKVKSLRLNKTDVSLCRYKPSYHQVKEHRQFPVSYMINNTMNMIEPPKVYLAESKAKLVSSLLFKIAKSMTKR